jgi:hypothetical protein
MRITHDRTYRFLWKSGGETVIHKAWSWLDALTIAASLRRQLPIEALDELMKWEELTGPPRGV